MTYRVKGMLCFVTFNSINERKPKGHSFDAPTY